MWQLLEKIKKSKPLVHCITNYVSANDVANAIHSVGATPIMAEYIDEVEEITRCSSALVLNVGMLNREKLNSMLVAGRTANINNIPIIIDPVGCMASNFRKQLVEKLLDELKIAVIKGNYSEMMSLYGEETTSKGVDSIQENYENITKRIDIAKNISKKYNCVAIITGKIDIIANVDKVFCLSNGSELMTRITGSGCMLSGLIGAFVGASTENSLQGVILACCLLSVAGELAENDIKQQGLGTASMRVKIIDYLSTLGEKELKEYVKITEKVDISKKLLLYAITPQYTGDEIYFEKIEQALRGGVTILQLREKNLQGFELEQLAIRVKNLCKKYNVPLIINDDPYLVKKIDADGLHLGQDDMSIEEARRIVGEKIIGISTHNKEEAIFAENSGADYIGVGAVFETKTKDNTISLSMEKLEEITKSVTIPCVAIGGINQDNIKKLKGKGLSGVAVISVIFSAEDVERRTYEFKKNISLD